MPRSGATARSSAPPAVSARPTIATRRDPAWESRCAARWAAARITRASGRNASSTPAVSSRSSVRPEAHPCCAVPTTPYTRVIRPSRSATAPSRSSVAADRGARPAGTSSGAWRAKASRDTGLRRACAGAGIGCLGSLANNDRGLAPNPALPASAKLPSSQWVTGLLSEDARRRPPHRRPHNLAARAMSASAMLTSRRPPSRHSWPEVTTRTCHGVSPRPLRRSRHASAATRAAVERTSNTARVTHRRARG